jgi:hypothetical protein
MMMQRKNNDQQQLRNVVDLSPAKSVDEILTGFVTELKELMTDNFKIRPLFSVRNV